MSNLPARSDVKPVNYQRDPSTGEVKTTFTDGTVLAVPGRYYGIASDSGQVSAFRPAIYQKPQGPIGRIHRAWSAFVGKPEPMRTTEQGASSAASPVTFYLSLWTQLFGRRTRIEDTRALYLSDPRVFRSVNMYVDEALRGGPTIRVQGKKNRDKKAREIAKKAEKIYNATLVQEWGKGLVVEGDLFIQHVVDPHRKELVSAVAMPGVGMQRLVNDADQFVNEDHAFEQIDSMTFEHVAYFSNSLMTHSRWSKINGDQYGTSELCTARRLIRAIELVEQALTISRMVRAPLRRLHNVGTETNTGSAQELINYKADNGFFSGKNEAYNPQSVMIDYYANGNVKIDTLLGDPHQAQIDDIRYMANVLMCALPTPGPFFGFGIEEAKRDVLEDMKALWVRSHEKIQQYMDEPVRHGFELQLTLAGIDPSTIEYNIQWARPSLDTTAETVDWLTVARSEGGLSQKTYVQEIAKIIGTSDIEQELADIEAEKKLDHENEISKRTAGMSMKEQMEEESPTKNKRLKTKMPTTARN